MLIAENKMLFAFLDGDNIGPTIEILLLEGRLEEASMLSKRLVRALDLLSAMLTVYNDVEILIAGGDDLLIKYNQERHGLDLIKDVRKAYLDATGMTMSCGIGENIADSINNLRLAKLYGKNQIKGLR